MADLFSDPVGWAKNQAGTKLRFYVFSGLHIGIYILLLVWNGASPTDGPYFAYLWFGVALPIIYLYAIHRLVKLAEPQNDI